MTNKKSLLPTSVFVGFEPMLNVLDNLTQHAADKYPPHSIIKESDEDFIIEVALAGFERKEIDVELKNRVLTVTGDHVCKNRNVIHRGISTKKFKKQFRLSEYVQVSEATLKDGILSVYLKVIIPEDERSRKIQIKENED